MENLVIKPQVGFLDAVKLAFKKAFTFTGRIRRSEFWWGVLGIWIITLLLSLIPIVGQILCIFLGIVNLAMTFRRLHDTAHSGWWIGVPLLLSLIAIAILIGSIGITGLTEGDAKAIAGASMGALVVAGLLYLAAGIMQIIVFIFCLMDSQQIANKYGESPKYTI